MNFRYLFEEVYQREDQKQRFMRLVIDGCNKYLHEINNIHTSARVGHEFFLNFTDFLAIK